MTSSEIRQSFLDFFKSKQHTIVPSSSLMPDSPNLLFTNAGMNQFVPIFLGQVKCPYNPPRAADTQKCIRAGGKHNDLDDVGLDTYHHTFFEMLGNWSFGDYFKQEAIDWAWELITEVWKFPKNRLYATVYSPDKTKGDPSEFDQEAYDLWAAKFTAAGLDPKVHIVYGNKKDNFWMMGETGPCGPCSELHVDLTPQGDTKGALVNKGSAECIEIWNLVFIQFNANPDGTFSPLPARHVDTGMGFERVSSIIQCTKNFTDFTGIISNYETDIFRPIFDRLEKMSGKKYTSTLPAPMGSTGYQPVPPGYQPGGTSEAHVGQSNAGLQTDAPPHSAGLVAQRHGQVARATQEQERIDVAFRVIADHIRTLSFAIADGIQPGNTDRNYVLRRILRRAVRYGRTLGFHHPFFYKLVDVLAETMGDVFPEIRAKKTHVQEVIQREEEAFNKTLDNGIEMFEDSANEMKAYADFLKIASLKAPELENKLSGLVSGNKSGQEAQKECGVICSQLLDLSISPGPEYPNRIVPTSEYVPASGEPINSDEFIASSEFRFWGTDWHTLVRGLYDVAGEWDQEKSDLNFLYLNIHRFKDALARVIVEAPRELKRIAIFPGDLAFKLYDTYGFPLDLTELMARERGLTVDVAGFNKLMEEQRARGRAAQIREVISLSQIETTTPTKFVGYELADSVFAKVLEVVESKGKTAVVLDTTPFYAEMGGQVGDTGLLGIGENLFEVVSTSKSGNTFLHVLKESDALIPQAEIARAHVFPDRRRAIERHHTVTHLLHWALHEVASREASQKGSFVGPDKLTFDFNSAPLTPAQVSDIEKLVNERILENAGVSWTEVPYGDVKSRKDVMQFFGDKYGDVVRVVQIGGEASALNGYSMELCGGTHTRATGEIGLFRIVSESAVAAGVRRIEAVAGLSAYQAARQEAELLRLVAGRVNTPVAELEKKIDALLAQQKEMEKTLRAANQKEAAGRAKELLAKADNSGSVPAIIANIHAADGDTLQTIVDSLKGQFKGVVVLGGAANGAVALVASVSPEFTAKVQAGKIIQAIAPIVGGKGGGKPDNARGGGKEVAKLDEALAKAKELAKG